MPHVFLPFKNSKEDAFSFRVFTYLSAGGKGTCSNCFHLQSLPHHPHLFLLPKNPNTAGSGFPVLRETEIYFFLVFGTPKPNLVDLIHTNVFARGGLSDDMGLESLYFSEDFRIGLLFFVISLFWKGCLFVPEGGGRPVSQRAEMDFVFAPIARAFSSE